jgi:hypothetical protein
MIVLTKPNSGRYRRWLGLSDPTEAAALAAGYDSIVHDFKCDDVDGGMCTLARLESAIKHLANEWAGSLPNDSPQLETSPPKSSANPDAARRRHFVRRDEAHASGGSGGDARQPKRRRSGRVAGSGGHAEGDQVPATAAAPLRLADAVGSAGSMVPIQGGSGPAGDMSRLADRADHTKAADARAHDARAEHMRAECTAEGERNAHRLRLKAWVALRREQPERGGGGGGRRAQQSATPWSTEHSWWGPRAASYGPDVGQLAAHPALGHSDRISSGCYAPHAPACWGTAAVGAASLRADGGGGVCSAGEVGGGSGGGGGDAVAQARGTRSLEAAAAAASSSFRLVDLSAVGEQQDRDPPEPGWQWPVGDETVAAAASRGCEGLWDADLGLGDLA